jgi:hypothetical protein
MRATLLHATVVIPSRFSARDLLFAFCSSGQARLVSQTRGFSVGVRRIKTSGLGRAIPGRDLSYKRCAPRNDTGLFVLREGDAK